MDACLNRLGKQPVASERQGSSHRRRRGGMGRGALLSSRLGGLRERRKLAPSGVRGEAPAENGFQCISSFKKHHLLASNLYSFWYCMTYNLHFLTGSAYNLRIPCSYMATEVSIRRQNKGEVGIRRIPAYTPQYTPAQRASQSVHPF